MTLTLPSYVAPTKPARRPTAQAVNRVKTSEQKLTVAGYNEVVPIVYGWADVAGPMIAGPVSKSGWVYYAVAVSHGPIEGFATIKVGSDEYPVTGDTQTVTGSGYEYRLRFYDGTQTGVDAQMIEGIGPNFTDTFNGVAYVSVKARGTNLNLGAGASFIVNGKKIKDPRDNIVKYTENPALHLYDMVTNNYYGLGRELIGVNRLADHCDSIFNSAPLALTGHAIQTQMSENAIIDMMCLYAEAIWGFDGDAIYVIPDAKVNENDVIDIPAKFIKDGTVSVFTDTASDIPNSVSVSFNTLLEGGELSSAPAFVSREPSTASSPFMNSNLELPGVFRRSEAQRRAEQRLSRLQHAGRVSFQMFDVGAEVNVGDVIRFPDYYGIGGVLLRVMAQPDMIAAGVYQTHTELYEEGIYSEVTEGTLVIPAGGVVGWLGGSVLPDGASALTFDDNLLIRGASGLTQTVEVVEKQGATPFTESVPIPMAGEHRAEIVKTWSFRINNEGRFTSDNYPYVNHNYLDDGSHNHGGSLSVKATASDYPNYLGDVLATRLIVFNENKQVPNGVCFFHEESLNSNFYSEALAQGFLSTSKGSASTSQLENSWAKGFGSTPEDGGHRHGGYTTRYPEPGGSGAGDYEYLAISNSAKGYTSGVHKHRVLGGAELRLASKRLRLVRSLIQRSMLPSRSIIGFLGDVLPAGWALCDGQNGTIDLRDLFIRLDGEQSFNVNEMIFRINSLEPAGEHIHRTAPYVGGGTTFVRRYFNYSSYVSKFESADHPKSHGLHTHEVNWSKAVPYIPKHIKFAFIQYIGTNNE